MGLEAFFPSIRKFFFLMKTLLSTSEQYGNVCQFAVRHVATVSLSNRQRFLDKLSHSHHRDYTCLLPKYRVIIL